MGVSSESVGLDVARQPLILFYAIFYHGLHRDPVIVE